MIQLVQAWKELASAPRFSLLFLFNLALGLSGLVTMDAFRGAIQRGLEENERALLSGDLAVSARRAYTESELALIREATLGAEARSESLEFFSMVRGPKGARLVLLKGVDSAYPLVGSLGLNGETRAEGAAVALHGAWVDTSLARQLGVESGSELTIGNKTVKVEALLTLDPTQSFRGMAVAGKIVVPLALLRDSGLLRPESTASYVQLFRFEKLQEEKIDALKSKLGNEIRVQTARESGEDSTRALRYLSDFLGLAALVALFLSALGAAYLYNTWLQRRVRSFALYQVLGWSWRQSALVPLYQALLLALGAAPLALVLALGELSLIERVIHVLAPIPLRSELQASTVMLAFLLPAFASALLALPFLLGLRSMQLRELLGGQLPSATPHPRFFWFVPALFVFYALALWQAQSYRNAGLFVGALVASLALLALAGWGLLRVGGMLGRIGALSWPVRHAFLHLSRRAAGSLSVFTALALGALLLNLLPQLRASLLAELEAPGSSKLPSIFFFDIQDEQLSPLQEQLGRQGLKLQNLSPLVRARLLSVNGESFERTVTEGFRTREEETEARFRNRGFNLSYREILSDAEEIVVGRPFRSGAAEISVEQRFAERLKLKLGDRLRFDVQGVELEGEVVNLRKVRWTSFQPNFFLLFSDGTLNEAPKSWLASLPALDEETKLSVLDQLAVAFPNVSAVDVRATVERGLELLERMRWALHLMAAVSLFAGLVVLYAIANRQAELRRWDMNLCKILGAKAGELRKLQLTEFFALALSASAFGAALSIGFTWVLARWIFEGNFAVDGNALAASVAGTVGLSVVVALAGSGRVWKSQPAELLQE